MIHDAQKQARLTLIGAVRRWHASGRPVNDLIQMLMREPLKYDPKKE